jgi:hypothetical protein
MLHIDENGTGTGATRARTAHFRRSDDPAEALVRPGMRILWQTNAQLTGG